MSGRPHLQAANKILYKIPRITINPCKFGHLFVEGIPGKGGLIAILYRISPDCDPVVSRIKKWRSGRFSDSRSFFKPKSKSQYTYKQPV